MKVLFTCMPHGTHLQPLVPLAWALRAAGHEVRVASQPELADAITAAGLTSVPVGTENWFMADPWAPELLGEILGAGGSEYVQNKNWAGPWDHEYLLDLEQVMIPSLFASFNSDTMIDDLVAYARHWEPDLVIWEPLTMAGGVVATVVGCPHVRVVYGADVTIRARQQLLALNEELEPEHREDPTAEWLAAVLDRFGRTYDETVRTGHLTVDVTPPSTRLDTDLPTLDVRYLPYNGKCTVPDWLAEPPRRPRVCLTLGISGELERAEVTLEDIVAGLADLDVEVVATLGKEYQDKLERVPDNTRLFEFVPMHDLLPTCDAVVHHGGVSTRATAEYHGVPQLMLAFGWDTIVKAQRNEDLGAGICLPAEQADVPSIRAAVQRLVDDPRFKAGAQKLRDELLAMPSPAAAVPELERLAARHTEPAGRA